MNRYICIHGHFYQPPRENPWLEEVEWQDSAYPHHDWNQRITAECYGPNTASRILDGQKRIINIVNNYARISFNFGPTLLSWMERHEPEVYQAILEADRLSQNRFSGHGSAIAQVYNHMIMPLANDKDKRTQVLWGIRDFEYRFKRKPEGMWLTETAVDIPTLEILAEKGIKFTILAPYQARRMRKIGERVWKDARGGKIDPKIPYYCHLPSGKSIIIFFYDGPVSQEIAFGGLLRDGINFAERLSGLFGQQSSAQLVHVATDGETYGHHQRFGDMALAYCLNHIESKQVARITIYGEYLEKFPPTHEVRIYQNSSWSCVHGLGRWKENCGCRIGGHAGWQQNWRAPLREAMDWLREALVPLYEQYLSQYLKEPWQAREDYIDVVLDRSVDNTELFLARYALRLISTEEKIKILKLLEMQRHAMLMYTSCGWFFDEISGIEGVQVLQYAARAMQLAREITGKDFEGEYLKILEKAPSNLPKFGHGAGVYVAHVKPLILNMLSVGAHYAVSSIFEKYPQSIRTYCYNAQSEVYERTDIGRQKLVVGRARLKNEITWEEDLIVFAVVHLGDYNLIGGVCRYESESSFASTQQTISEAFRRGNIPQVVSLMDKYFGNHNYSLWNLFKDEQRKIISQIAAITLEEIETAFRQIYEHHYPIMRVMNELRIPLPTTFLTTIELIYNTNLRKLLEGEYFDPSRLASLVREIKNWNIRLDTVTLNYVAARNINKLMERFAQSSDDVALLQHIEAIMVILSSMQLHPEIWKAQNIYFAMSYKIYNDMLRKTEKDPIAKRWVEYFCRLGDYLKTKVV